MQIKTNHFIIGLIVLLTVLFVAGSCTLKCKNQEGYKTLALGTIGSRGLVDQQVDHYSDIRTSGQWRTIPDFRRQPLENGTLINPETGKMAGFDLNAARESSVPAFSQYQNHWGGLGRPLAHIYNDERMRFNQMNIGNSHAHNLLGRLRVGEAIDDILHPNDNLAFKRTGGKWGVYSHIYNDVASYLNPSRANPYHPAPQ